MCIPQDFWQQPDTARAASNLDLVTIVQLLRSRARLTQESIARLMDISQASVSKLESGHPLQNLSKVRRGLEGLGVSQEGTARAHLPPRKGKQPAGVVDSPFPLGHSGEAEKDSQGRWLLAEAAHITVGILDTAESADQSAGWQPAAVPIPAQVTHVDVDHLDAMIATLRASDYRFGGGVTKDAVDAYVQRAHHYLQQDHASDVARRLRMTLADLHNLAGWVDFDIGSHPTARHHFALALRAAKQANAPSLSATILYRMGRLHLHLGLTEDALKFFQLGQLEAQASTCHLTVALLCANEAWAHALLDEETRSQHCLDRAQDSFARADHNHAPHWVQFFGEADLLAMTGVASASLPTQSPRSYTRSTDNLHRALSRRDDDMSRSRAFELSALATAHLRNGDTDIGVTTGHQAVDLALSLRSGRVVDRLEPIRTAAVATPGGEAQDLAERVANIRPT
ncbi:helix-turn-helix domain-containing protein [Salinactinospora qingdaonensis]|uniref:Helix-turn-helix transcriptional regulator n=1 Tax=Salinactinospora qingdaonensis TaxID=702744 RepID=A0ABP7GCV7_9ACTN